jgi:regulator of ribonuclease activity A
MENQTIKRTFFTTDLCDAHPSVVAVVESIFRDFGAAKSFMGEIVTLKIFEDNALVREMLETDGTGKVLVIDGGGSLRCALVGGNLGVLGAKNGWQGIVVFGAVRDSLELAQTPIGIKALATNPMKSIKKGAGERNIAVKFGGVTFRAGDWLFADEDGIIVSVKNLLN